MLLENVIVQMGVAADGAMDLRPAFALPIVSCAYNAVGTGYVVFERKGAPITSITNVLKFMVRETDDDGNPEEDAYEDEYAVEDLELEVGDYVLPSLNIDFDKLWTDLQASEVIETYALTAVSSIKGTPLIYLDINV
jgi:coatomer protein complex subunit gamma